jgi:hypothetical protein
MLNLTKTAVDPDLMERGVWWTIWQTSNGQITGVPVGDALDGKNASKAAIRIAPSGVAFDRAVEEERARIVVDDSGRATDDQATVIVGRALATACVRDWANLCLTEDETPVPFSVEEAARLLSSTEFVSLREFVSNAAANRSAVLARQEKADTGNS